MSGKIKIPLRIQFLVIALSLAIVSSIIGLSAYLTDTDTYQSTFRTAAGDELGFRLTGEAFEDESVIPGETVTLNVTASVQEPNDLYLFVQLDIPSDFTVNGFNSVEWHPIEDGSNIYFYGNSSLVALGTTNGTSSNIFDSLTLSTSVTGSNDYSVFITGYAIQAENIPANSTPKQVFDMITGGAQNENP